MDIFRGLVAMIGGVACIIGIISVWGTWVSNESTSGPWALTIIGAVMWLQALPILLAAYDEKLRNPVDD